MKALLTLILLSPPWSYFVGVTNPAKQPPLESAGVRGHPDPIPTIPFCEMVKNPRLYFDKSVRLTATLEQAEEAQYLSDGECLLSHDEQIGVGYVDADEKETRLRNKAIELMHSPEFGGRARVRIVGILRDSLRRDFAWYHYRFDILRFEDVSHVTIPYEGELQAGKTYLAGVEGDARNGLSLMVPMRIPQHYAVRIEWTNLAGFPALKRLRTSSSEQQIVFSVLSDDIRQMTANRWNRTLRCKIIRVE